VALAIYVRFNRCFSWYIVGAASVLITWAYNGSRSLLATLYHTGLEHPGIFLPSRPNCQMPTSAHTYVILSEVAVAC
jgi:hypothetical protein